LTLLNGARQALARGAKFGGLTGRGNASGRTFRVEVALAVSKSKNTRNRRSKQQVLSSLNICQVSNNTCESLNGDASPILQASALADPANPKRFDLILPMDSVAPDSMLSALMTDGKFQLEAPNRLTRESFLLSLGIANYKGRPADLNATTILFREDPVLMMLDDHDDFGSINSGSSCSTYSTPSKASSSLAGSVEPTTPDSATSLRSIESVQTKTTTAQDRIAEMEEEMQFLRAKLTRKDKVVSELQRQITRSDTVFQKTKQSLSTTQQELKQCKQEGAHEILSLKTAQANVIRLQGEQSMRMSTFETKILTQTEKITELEKANRNLQNEKAVLAAAVEARDSKLGKMGELQGSFEKLSEQVAQTDVLRMELFNSNQKYADVQKELERVSLFEKQLQQDLDQTKASGEKLTTRLDEEELKTVSSQEQLASLQKKNQLLKAERNNFKQKNDSLSKEISKLCRNGRTIKEIEKMIGDHEARAHEVEELRKQKRKALEDVHMYRTSYEQSKVAQQLAGVDYETRKALERNAEMERLLLDLTEYVTAQEMQVETLKQVNEALQAEIHSLAQASLNKNEV
jgi:chromosome segregation ATPase